jgi:NAD(P)-dependent dehydrogenase (short-subunit alcohol dehydrogenase family)
MDLELSDKVAVVTGASKGIGLAVVPELTGEGALVVAGARSTETLEGLDRVSAYSVDLVDPDGPGRLVAHAIDLRGRVDVLVNNVDGVHPRVEGFLSITDADFEASLQLNFFHGTRERGVPSRGSERRGHDAGVPTVGPAMLAVEGSGVR